MVIRLKDLSERPFSNNSDNLIPVPYLIMRIDLQIPLLIIKVITIAECHRPPLAQIIHHLALRNLIPLDRRQLLPVAVDAEPRLKRLGKVLDVHLDARTGVLLAAG